ncbi:hypothetical protein HOY80DRAFT_1064744 [Tuber brumale]|nr:hypothetical protein HOY80DRAFT_1064744 [Tuber brumale]
MGVLPWEMEEEVAMVAEQKIVVRLLVAVAESGARAEVAENVTIVEVARKGKEVAVVAEEAAEGVGSHEEDWTLMKRRVRESGMEKRRRLLEEERDAVRKRMNVRCPAKVEVPNTPVGPRIMRVRLGSHSGYGSPGPSGLSRRVVVSEGVERVGEGVVPRMPGGVPTGPRSYAAVATRNERRLSFKGLRSVRERVESSSDRSWQKSLELESENSKLRHHVSVLSRRLHEVIAELKVQRKITAAFCPFCGKNHNQVDWELWMERVVEEPRRSERVECAGSMDVEPLVMEEEVPVVVKKKFLVRLQVVVAESVAEAGVAEDVAIVEARKGKEVVVAEEAEVGVGSWEEDWTLVKRRVRESGEARRRRLLEEERDAVRKRMHVWCPAKVEVPNAPLGPRSVRVWCRSDSGYGSPCPSSLSKRGVVSEGVELVGEGLRPVLLVGVPTGPRSYAGMAAGSEKRLGFKGWRGLMSVEEGVELGSGRGWQVETFSSGSGDQMGLGRNGKCGIGWYGQNPDGTSGDGRRDGVVVEKKFVVRLPVAVAESAAGAEVAGNVAMVEVARKGQEVAVVAVEAEKGVGSREEDWTLVKRRRPAKVEVPNVLLGHWSMRVRFGSDSGYGSPGPRGLGKSVVVSEELEKVGDGVVPRMPVGVPTGPRSYAGVAMGSEKWFGFRGLRSVTKGNRMNGLDSDGRLVVCRGSNEWDGRENGGRWCSVHRFVAVPPSVNKEEFRRRFGAMQELVREMKTGIGRLLKARNEAAKQIAYREVLKACDDEEWANMDDDERFIRRLEAIFAEEEAFRKGKLWGEASASLMARARGRRSADMRKANELGKKWERRVNKGKGNGISHKGKGKAAFMGSDGDDSLLSESEAEARRLWLEEEDGDVVYAHF